MHKLQEMQEMQRDKGRRQQSNVLARNWLILIVLATLHKHEAMMHK